MTGEKKLTQYLLHFWSQAIIRGHLPHELLNREAEKMRPKKKRNENYEHYLAVFVCSICQLAPVDIAMVAAASQLQTLGKERSFNTDIKEK